MKRIVFILCGCFILQSCCVLNPFQGCKTPREVIGSSKLVMPENTACVDKETTEAHETTSV